MKLGLLSCDAAAEKLSQLMRLCLLPTATATSLDEFAKELSRFVKLGLLPTDARWADEEIELELGVGFCVDGGPRLPWRLLIRWIWRTLVMVPFCFVVFQLVTRLTRPPASRRPARHPPLFPLLCFLTVVSWLTHPFVLSGMNHLRTHESVGQLPVDATRRRREQ